MLKITGLYAAVLALFYVLLSARVIQLRFRDRVSLGAGESKELEKRIRIHGNFAEYVPFALLLIAILELQGLPAWGLHAFGLTLIAGRLAHFYGLSQTGRSKGRTYGMILTFLMLIAAAVTLLVRAVL
jgi:uncharacterized membrane protein YecN with MAPEG domain